MSAALLKASGRKGLILPRIAPLGALEPASEPAEFEPTPEAGAPPLAVGELTRRMTLARMIRAWSLALQGAIRSAGPDGLATDAREPALVANSAAQAFALAGDLAALIDDMIIEGVPWSRLETIVADAFDPYWKITLDFLKIAVAAWPDWLVENGLADRASLAAALVDREIAALPEAGPTIIAGSTGTNRATARLIGAVARAPLGAVVLPQLDLALDDEAWSLIGEAEDGLGATAGHPQAALSRLLRAIGAERADVREVGRPEASLQARANLLTEALRPAGSTEAWSLSPLPAETIAAGLERVTLIEAATEAEESLALAVAMREALETPGRTAALVTPDPALGRRVATDLARWGVEVESSAGRPLGETSAGALARLALAAALDFSALPVAALLHHGALRLGRDAAAAKADAEALDLTALRMPPPASGFADLDLLFARVDAALESPHAHRALRPLRGARRAGAEALMRDLSAALAPLRELSSRTPLRRFIEIHRDALTELAAPEPLHGLEGGEALEALFDEWTLSVDDGFTLSPRDYAVLLDELLATQRAPSGRGGHPRLAILGLLEARLIRFDLTLVAALDETVWPPAAETDAFLNRRMRASLGLSAPERRIGQTAHDFVAALGAPDVILSRARKRGGSPTVASRFLQRIGAVAGEGAYAAMAARGERYLDFARALDRPLAETKLPAPQPRPPAELRPRSLSVTRIETLRRDPYAIYAERVLKLAPLSPLGAEAGPREIGEVWHSALEAFGRTTPTEESPAAARARLLELAEEAFAGLNADAAFRALRWPRIVNGLDGFLAFDAKRRAGASRIWYERQGRLEWTRDGLDFTITAKADRIERNMDGEAVIVDYKTGAPPGLAEVQVGFAPQLTLEAAMLSRGAFPEIGRLETAQALYLKLGGAKGVEEKPLKFEGATFREVAEAHLAGAQAMMAEFARAETPYLSKPFPKFLARGTDYDHLARVQEWSATGGKADDAGGTE